MSTLRVIIDQIVAPVPGGVGRYTEELTRALIATAPSDTHVAGIVAASPGADDALISRLLPGLHDLHRTVLSRRALSAAWQHGIVGRLAEGMVHAPSLQAPLHRHQLTGPSGGQIAVTIHDAVPWTHPETLSSRGVSWHRALAKRAERFADAIVVPTHAVAHELSGILDLGDRVRVIGGAVGTGLRLPEDDAARAAQLALPERYVLSVGTLEPRKGLEALLTAMSRGVPTDVQLLIVGPAGWGGVDVAAVARGLGLTERRVRTMGKVSDVDLAVLYDRAAAFVMPSLAEGFGLPVVEAFSFGTPVVHSDAPSLAEVAAGAGFQVALADAAGYPDRLAEAIRAVLEDRGLAERLHASGRKRALDFSWHESAEKVWRLHADL
jgi:glycosyltransferase involved in cell wall biosynthesis